VVPQGEVVSVETSPIGERLSSAWKHRRDLGRQRREVPRDDVSVDFVVEWQLRPLEAETASSDSPRMHVQDLSAYPG
jgi:hypothetical protein